MSDRVAVFNHGRIEQIGPPAELYEHPANEFVASFVGVSNVLERGSERFSVRPEKIRILAAGATPDPGAGGERNDQRSRSTQGRRRGTSSTSTKEAR